jgi:biopolymer transport protein ExbB
LAQTTPGTPPAPGATAPGTTPAAADSAYNPSLWDYIMDGGPVGFLLIGLSVVAVALTIRNIMMLRLAKQAPPEITQRLTTLVQGGNMGEVANFCTNPENDSFMTRVVAAALARCQTSPFGLMEFRAGVEDAGPNEVDRLHRSNEGLAIIAAVGPMLGLLGTVIGMVGAFRTIGTMTGAARSSQLATFMSMALVNTAQGLVVAIPCTIAYALLRRQIDSMAAQLGTMLERITSMVQAQAQAARPGARPHASIPVPQPSQPSASSTAPLPLVPAAGAR